MTIIAAKATCNWGGIKITELTDEYVVSCENYGNEDLRKAKAKIRYTANGKPYFMRQGRREYLREYMRV